MTTNIKAGDKFRVKESGDVFICLRVDGAHVRRRVSSKVDEMFPFDEVEKV